VTHIGSKHRYTFYPAAIGDLVTRWTLAKKEVEEEPEAKKSFAGG